MVECFLFDNCNHVDCNEPFCVRKYKLTKLYNNSLLSETQRKRIALKVDSDGTDLEEFKQLAAIEKDIVNFVKEGRNLYIHSNNCGNGKTSWAIRLIQAYFNNIWALADETECHALFIDVGTFLSEWKNNISNKSSYIKFIIENIEKADLVVWDEVASKTGSDYDIDKLLTAINARINAGKANIFTSNQASEAITTYLGERLASRICIGSTEIILNGADKRGTKIGG